MWDAQVEMAKEMFKNQRTFVDTSTMPKMAELLSMNALVGMGMMPGASSAGHPAVPEGAQLHR